MRKLAAGNWKMNGMTASIAEARAVSISHPAPGVDILICPPATLLSRLAEALANSAVALGAQNCHAAQSGAHTGDIAAPMLAEAGASAVIVGHSERRTDHAETDADVRAKAEAAQSTGLVAIICLGETLDQREAGITLPVVRAQLAGSLPPGS
ncbi:MAG: triose-phosphate isomerase, partial [Pseudomonadota bacterium]